MSLLYEITRISLTDVARQTCLKAIVPSRHAMEARRVPWASRKVGILYSPLPHRLEGLPYKRVSMVRLHDGLPLKIKIRSKDLIFFFSLKKFKA